MSHDALFVVREAGREAYFYDRWAALQIDRALLAGPHEMVGWVRSLHRTDEPAMVAWLCGAVLVDIDAKRLLHWNDQPFGEGALDRYFLALLRERWLGWETRRAMCPLLEFSRALGREPRELDEARRRAERIDLPSDFFSARWKGLLTSMSAEELADWVAVSGEEGVRSAAEHDCWSWVTVRARDGTLFDQRGEYLGGETVLRAGPALAELARDGGPRPNLLCPGFERDHHETVFIDEASGAVYWWEAKPSWMSTAAFCGPRWPGWTLAPEPRGPRGHVERSGRPFAAIRTPSEDVVEWLVSGLERLLGQSHAPLEWLARTAQRLAAEEPGATVRIETSATRSEPIGTGSLDEPLRSRLVALVAEVDAE